MLRLVRVREWEEGPELWPVGSLGESNMMNSLSRKPNGKMFVAQKHDSGDWIWCPRCLLGIVESVI